MNVNHLIEFEREIKRRFAEHGEFPTIAVEYDEPCANVLIMAEGYPDVEIPVSLSVIEHSMSRRISAGQIRERWYKQQFTPPCAQPREEKPVGGLMQLLKEKFGWNRRAA